ncbi:unnamed protein product (macronuclear) [Paramecium tetraurelia]|uniref:Uncharacterized protein n=1 Tax=Paramecium tetraurelia TaxID=5888 RepID=A0D479_PARTE|nr:uncharacterized protein GSPATT00013312001 [Paramecium tetraurelia]CAK77846.1 unnamed protein product [Paramecium tetraurelia]|eukprot:XP_001445243.1 hypothetical protein (macronuclear) [Paramecium tetraurelia strain d4-2]
MSKLNYYELLGQLYSKGDSQALPFTYDNTATQNRELSNQQYIASQNSIIVENDKLNTIGFSNTFQFQISRLLDLDDLLQSGRVYEDDSCQSIISQVQTRNQKNNNKVSKSEQKQNKLKKKVEQVQKSEKNVHLGTQCQQLQFPSSSLRPRYVKIYQRNDELCMKRFQLVQLLFDEMSQIYPQCTDWDVIQLLDLSNKSFDTAFKLLKESSYFVQYYLQGIQQFLNKQYNPQQMLIELDQKINGRKNDLKMELIIVIQA